MVKIRNVLTDMLGGFVELFGFYSTINDQISKVITVLLAITISTFIPLLFFGTTFLAFFKPDYLILILLTIITITIFIISQSKKAELTISKITDYCLFILNANDPKEVNLSSFGKFKIHISSAILKSCYLLNKINNKPLRNVMKFISILAIFLTVQIYVCVLIFTVLFVFLWNFFGNLFDINLWDLIVP